jgi:uncharacterized repeat protein (TIGR02543 family)
MGVIVNRSFRQNLALISIVGVALGSLPVAMAQASGSFDQPAAGAEWTYSTPTPITSTTSYLDASNTFASSGLTVSASIGNVGDFSNSFSKPAPNTTLVPRHGSAVGDFLVPPVDTATIVLAPRVDEGAGGFGYCKAPASVMTGPNNFIPAGSAWTCSDIGTLTITFSEPVVNPLISLSGLGGGQFTKDIQTDVYNAPVLEYMNTAGLRLTQPAGATVSLVAGNGNLAASGVDIGVPVPASWAFCDSTYQAPAVGGNPGFAARAGCGTVQINGSGTMFTFSLSKKVYTIADTDDVSFAGGFPLSARSTPDLFALQVGAYLPASQTIIFDGNGATSGSVAPITGPTGWDVTLAANGFTPPGTQSFLGWSANPNATTPDSSLDPGDVLAMPDGGLTLYAVWDVPILAWVVYDSNGGTGTTAPTSGAPESTVSLAGSGFTGPGGAEFLGWSTVPGGSVDYQPSDDFPLPIGGATLYAVWAATPAAPLVPRYTLAYDANGGSCSAPSQTDVSGTWLYTYDSNSCMREGYVFKGWNTSPDGSGLGFDPGAPTHLTGDNTLFAQWELLAVEVRDSATATSVGASVSGSVAGNGSLPSGSTFVKASDPANGSVVMNADGSYTYTPRPGFVGVDSFRYTACAPGGSPCATGTVSVTVADVMDDVVVTAKESSLSSSVALNANVPPGSVFSVVRQPANGTVVMQPNGDYIFTPNPGFVGSDTFTYQVCVPAGSCMTATVTVTVIDGPVRNADPLVQMVNPRAVTPLTFTPRTPVRGGSLSISKSGASMWGSRVVVPGKGTWVVKNGTVEFIPDPRFYGRTTIRYRVIGADGTVTYSTFTAVRVAIPSVVTGGR